MNPLPSLARRIHSKTPARIRTAVGKGYLAAKVGIQRRKNLKKYGTYDMFLFVIIENNTVCNRRCSYCPNSANDKASPKNSRLMPVETYHKIIDDLAKVAYEGGISFSFYNEPTLDDRLPSFAEYARSRLQRANLVLTSNGTTLSLKSYHKMVEAGFREFQLTQHGEAMEPGVAELFAHLGIDPPKTKGFDTTYSFGDIKIKYNRYADDHPLSNRGGSVKPKVVDHSPVCEWYGAFPVITVDGDVLLCCNDYFSEHKFGNVRDTDLMGIWNSPAYRKIRAGLRKKDYSLDICRRCVGL